jgi:hypothetical protein
MIPGQTTIYDFIKEDTINSNNATIERLTAIANVIAINGRPDEEFYYLGGPMSNLPQFNFPRFFEVAEILRDDGLNIVSPAELDDAKATKVALASEDGTDTKATGHGWEDYLARDVVICSLATCRGGIFLEGWENSRGARLETFVLEQLGKELYRYEPKPDDYSLVPFDRTEALSKVEAVAI